MDVTTASVSAYGPHVSAYATAHAGKVADLADRLVHETSRGSRVLDAGCGPGRDMRRFAVAGRRAVGVDLSAEMLRLAQGARVRGDLRALPFRDRSFDAVWACAALVHLPADAAGPALRELARVARHAAPFYASVKSTAGPRGWRDGRHGRRWFETWTAEEFGAAVRAAGFMGVAVQAEGDFVDAWAYANL